MKTAAADTHTHLSRNLQRSFPSLLGVDCELCGLSNSQAAALEAWTEGLDLEQTHKHTQVYS